MTITINCNNPYRANRVHNYFYNKGVQVMLCNDETSVSLFNLDLINCEINVVGLAVDKHKLGGTHAQNQVSLVKFTIEDGLSHWHSDGSTIIAEMALYPASPIVDVAIEDDILHVNNIVVGKDDVHFATLHIKANLIIIGKHSLAASALIGSQLALRHGGDDPAE